MSQGALARAAGIGKSQLSKYVNGKELPKLDSLEKLLVALRVSPLAFFVTLDYLDRKAKELDGPAPDTAEVLIAGPGLLTDEFQGAFSAVVRDLFALHGALVRSTIEEGRRGRS